MGNNVHPIASKHDNKLFDYSLARISDAHRAEDANDLLHCPFHGWADKAWQVATYHYHFGSPGDARAALRQSLRDSAEYFFGEWRRTRPVRPLEGAITPAQLADPKWSRPLADEHEAREWTWSPPDFKQPLAAALAIGDETMARRLADYLLAGRIESDETDGGMVDHWPDAIDVYEAYAELTLGKRVRLTPASPFRRKVPHKRIQMMRECVFAAAEGDAEACLDAVRALVKYVRTREIEKGDAYTAWVSTDATIAYHLMVRRLGRPLNLTRDDLYHVMVLKGD